MIFLQGCHVTGFLRQIPRGGFLEVRGRVLISVARCCRGDDASRCSCEGRTLFFRGCCPSNPSSRRTERASSDLKVFTTKPLIQTKRAPCFLPPSYRSRSTFLSFFFFFVQAGPNVGVLTLNPQTEYSLLSPARRNFLIVKGNLVFFFSLFCRFKSSKLSQTSQHMSQI